MKKRILSVFLAVWMAASVFPIHLFAADAATPSAQALSDVMENTNQSDGVILRKSVMPHLENGSPDGTVDVVIEAYTTGEVHQTMTAVPTDIVLVLDVSGSMDDDDTATVTTVTTYDAVYASTVQRGGRNNRRTYYGFQNTSADYYINLGTADAPHYVEVQRVNTDSSYCDYYSYFGENDARVYVYPQLASSVAEPTREYTYSVVPFYEQNVEVTSKVYAIDALKTAVDAFIESTHQKNAEIAEKATGLTAAQIEALQHRIAIVKFASNEYYDANGNNNASLAEGNNKDRNGYNYTQVVKNLTVVDADGHETLIDAVNALEVGGATAVDYGLTLAEMVLEPSNAGTATRNKVVIVFSDGGPTYGNQFSETVANYAIGVAEDIKFAGAKVYSISVAPDTDVTDTTSNINKFFHYMSSNYPNATDLDTPGANGDSAKGYYMVPSASSSLAMLFESIAQQIEAPTITLGEEAEIVDTMSAFFTIPDGAGAVTLETADRVKNTDGSWEWSDPVAASGMALHVQGKVVEVHGFDYDENYVSGTARTKGTNTEYYGTKLIITIHAAPDYDMIDTHASQITDGMIPSNDNTANLLNSDGQKVAVVDTPYIPANTVTYQYTDPVTQNTVSYAAYYRLPGASLIKSQSVPVIHGYTFSGWSTTDVTVAEDGSYTMPQKDVVFTGTFTANKHNVTYTITGYNPGASAPDGLTDVDFGTTVTISQDLSFPGYTFTGWTSSYPTIGAEDVSFPMPDHDVELIGYFTANSGVPFKTIHYIQNLDGTYTAVETVNGTGMTDEEVTAAVRVYNGFTLDTSVMDAVVTGVDGTVDTVSSGKITADGQFTMHQFHKRNKYTVTYAYEGSVPADAPALPETVEYYHGETVTIASHAEQDKVLHQTFAGWHTLDRTTVTDDMSAFVMPMGDITLYGAFQRIEGVLYKVEHYLMDPTTKTYPTETDIVDTFNDGIAGETVTGTPKKASVDDRFVGYVYDAAASASTNSGTVVASADPNYPLTLKLYYSLASYNVIYEYVGTLPAGCSPLPATEQKDYQSTVKVAPDAVAEGYTFSGWTVKEPAGVTIANGTFTMPASDVILIGSFTANPEYDVEYWLQTNDHAGYVKDEASSHSHTAPVGANVSAYVRVFEGYTENTTHPDRVPAGTVSADEKLVLKLYYDLNDYTVTYVFEEPVPAGAGLPPAETRHYGDTVTTPTPAVAGYTFSGWTSEQVGAVTAGESFTMPAQNVVLKGKFIAGEAAYKIEHYLMNDQGNYDGVTPHTETKTGVVGDSVRATSYQPYLDRGAKIDMVKTQRDGQWEGIVVASVTDPLTLKLYYSREPAARVVYHYEGGLTEDQWRELGWPDLPTDDALYYVGATVTAKDVVGTKPAKMVFEGWYSSDPTMAVAPNGTFTMPRLDASDPTIHLYGRWVSTEPQNFVVKYFVDGIEQTQYTQTYALNTPVTVLPNLENTASHSYTPWSAPESVTEGVDVIIHPDDTFTMTEHGEVHICCTSVPIVQEEKYTVRYYLDGRLYWEGGYALFDRHFIIDAPLLPPSVYFSGWSAPRTVMGSEIRVLQDGLGRFCFSMPAADVVLYGTTSTTPIADGALKIEKVAVTPDDFTGEGTYTFHIYQITDDAKMLVQTVTVKVSSKSGKGQSAVIALPKGNRYLVEEVGAGVLGYALTTVVTDEDGNEIPYGQTILVNPSVDPTVITFTNTYEEISLETRDHFGYIIGYPDDTVRPDAHITRAEVATIFFRLLTDEKRAEFWSQTNSFTDVAPDAWYNNAISTLANAGALSGYEDNTFRPDQPITRAELVKIAMSFYGTLGNSPDAFNDIGEHWAAAFINAAAEMGFVDGYGDNTFQPDLYVTRAEAMKIINRTLNRAPHKDHLHEDMITWVDNADTDAWYYAEVQEATNSHMYYRDNTYEIWEKIRPVRDWAELEREWSNAHSGKQ